MDENTEQTHHIFTSTNIAYRVYCHSCNYGFYSFKKSIYLLCFPQVAGHEELEQVTGVVSSLDIPQFGEDLKVKPISLTSDLWKQLTS